MSDNQHNFENKLFIVAESQNGYFTSRQAIAVGYKQNNFGYYLKSKKWLKIMRGIYRLKNYPVSDDAQYTIWSLWVGEKDNVPIGVYSHLTALQFYDVSEVISDKLHMTIPQDFIIRKKTESEILVLHKGKIDEKDVRYLSGYAITTLEKTLKDLAGSEAMEKDQFIQTIIQSYKKGYISLDFIFQTQEFKNFIPGITKYIH